jgi:hypothetical protein
LAVDTCNCSWFVAGGWVLLDPHQKGRLASALKSISPMQIASSPVNRPDRCLQAACGIRRSCALEQSEIGKHIEVSYLHEHRSRDLAGCFRLRHDTATADEAPGLARAALADPHRIRTLDF